MPFEILNAADMDDAKEIWARSFGDGPDFIDHYFGQRVPAGHVFGIRDSEELVSILCIVPMQYKIRDAFIQTAFISGVSTLPEKRGKGYISRIMSGVIPHLRGMGFALAFLSPAVEGMYEKYGFSYCTQKRVLTSDRPAILKMINRQTSEIMVCTDEDIPQLSSIYSGLLSQSSCIPERKREDWAFILHDLQKDGGGILMAYWNEKPAGYMAYRCEENTLESTESVFYEGSAFYALANEVLQKTQADTGTFSFQPEMNDIDGAALARDGMARIIDMKTITEILKDRQASKGQAVIEIIDPLCPWNDGIFAFGRDEDGCYHMERSEKTPEIQLPIGLWTQWVCGSAIQMGSVDDSDDEINEPAEQLAKIMPKKNCICFDKY